jgi:hypothetical protein
MVFPMKSGTLPACLSLFVCFPIFAPLAAEQPVEMAQAPLATTLDDLLARYYEANGGREHMLAIRSLRVDASLTMSDGSSGSLVYIKSQPNLVRSTWRSDRGMEIRRGNNGSQGWESVTMPDGRTRMRLGGGVPPDMFEWVLCSPESCGAVLEMLPTVRDGRQEYYRVMARFADGTTKEYWLDSLALNETRVVCTDSDGAQKIYLVPRSVKYDGIWFPAVQREIAADGSTVGEVVLNDVQMNIGLLPIFFDPPEELTSAQRQEGGAQAPKE